MKPQVNGDKNCKDDKADLYKFSHNEENIDMETYNNFPKNFDVQSIIEALTTGEGFAIIKNAVCKEDIQIIKERVLYFTQRQKEEHERNETLKRNENVNPIEKQNHFHGLIWGLINKGRIFEKLVLHPLIQNVSHLLCGEDAQVLSYTANTVAPGEPGQRPHIDYPYYPSFFPTDEKFCHSMMTQPLAIVFITLLTDFTVENGGTALCPDSHKEPNFPKDHDAFFEKAVQVTGRPGDMLVMRSSVQHCAMPNKSSQIRSGVILHMGPCFVRPYENIPDSMNQEQKNRASEKLRTTLGLDNPFPRLKN